MCIRDRYVDEEKEVNSVDEAIQGAKDIIAENISDNAEYRKMIKKICYREGVILTKASNTEEKSSYEMYYDFSEKISRIPSHRILAINRGCLLYTSGKWRFKYRNTRSRARFTNEYRRCNRNTRKNSASRR